MYTDNNKAQGELQYPCRPSSAFLVLVPDTVLINEEHIYTFASKALDTNQTSWSSLHHPRVWSEVWFVRIDTRMRMQLWCHWGCRPPCTADPQVDAKTPSIFFCCKTVQPNLFFYSTWWLQHHKILCSLNSFTGELVGFVTICGKVRMSLYM
jgi:hypothetical protein